MLVKATRLGFYENKRRREGETFPLKAESDFSTRWMKRVSPEDDARKDEQIKADLQAAQDKAKKQQKDANVADVEEPSEESRKSGESEPVEPKISEKELMKLNKDDLIQKAESLGLEVDESLTKAGIVNLILTNES